MQSISSITSSAPLLLFSKKISKTLVDTLFFTLSVQMQVPVSPISTLNGIDAFSTDGDKLGIDVVDGINESTDEGTNDGWDEGSKDGSNDGTALGIIDGSELGASEGSELGPKLGRADGFDDGYRLGLTLGKALGSLLG